jgi:hypothetical protein
MLKKSDFSVEDWKTVSAMKGAWGMTRQTEPFETRVSV